jgi:hypothetical protein
MSKQRAVSLCGCLAALPWLVGCAGGVGPSQAYGPPPGYAPPASPVAYPSPQAYAIPVPVADSGIYATSPTAPAAIIVLLPGAGASVIANPQLWAAQGFDVVAPPPTEMDRAIAAQQAAAARLIAAAQRLADAPIWLLGPNQAIEEAMASLPRSDVGEISGVVMTSTTSGARTCSEEMTYSYSGNGAPPKISVEKTGNACPADEPTAGAGNSGIVPAPRPVPQAPRVIEASVPLPAASPAAQRTAVQQIADAIKAPPG